MTKITKKERKWRWIAICTFVLFLLSFLLIPFMSIYALMIISPIAMLAWTFIVIYFIGYFPLITSMRQLKKKNMLDVTQDINLEKPLSKSKKCKIFCGSKAFLCTYPCRVIPYSDIAWVYIYKQTAYSVITIEQSIIIHCKDGKKYSVSGTPEECMLLLQSYIIPQSPDIVIGYGSKEKKTYLCLNPRAAKKYNRKKTIAGIVFGAITMMLVFICIINYPMDIPIYIITAAMLVTSIILICLGQKKYSK